jgi:hypothetical protein
MNSYKANKPVSESPRPLLREDTPENIKHDYQLGRKIPTKWFVRPKKVSIIPAYKENWEPFKATREEYIEETVITEDTEKIREQLVKISRTFLKDEDIDRINLILNDEVIMSKLVLVSDLSYRNIAILEMPSDKLTIQVDLEYRDLLAELSWADKLNYLREHAETIFLSRPKEPRIGGRLVLNPSTFH